MAGLDFESHCTNIPLKKKSKNLIKDLFLAAVKAQSFAKNGISFNRRNEFCLIWILPIFDIQ